MTTAAEIVSAAFALPESERMLVLEQIAASIKPRDLMAEGEPGYFEELARRSEAMRSGVDPGLDAFEAVARLDAELDGPADS